MKMFKKNSFNLKSFVLLAFFSFGLFGCSKYLNIEEASIVQLSENKTIIFPYKSNFRQRKQMLNTFKNCNFQIIDSSIADVCFYLGADTVFHFISTKGSNISVTFGNKNSNVIVKKIFKTGCHLDYIDKRNHIRKTE
jgi:hypothetical protein